MKKIKLLYYIGIALSMLVGIWHFFVPYMFQWYSYIPNEYGNLIVGIDWTNFFFSLLLTGISLLLILFCNKVFNGNGELFVFYGFLIFVWFCRVIITFIEPWPLEPIAWAAYGQQIAAFVIFIVQLIPFIYLLKQRKFTNKAKWADFKCELPIIKICTKFMLPFAHLNRFQFRHIMKLKNGGAGMRDEKYHLYVDSQDRSILLHSLVALKN